jgi:hypothetical protein
MTNVMSVGIMILYILTSWSRVLLEKLTGLVGRARGGAVGSILDYIIGIFN